MAAIPRLLRHLRAFLRDCQGLAVVEFAAVLPVLIVMFFGCFEATRYVLIVTKVDRVSTAIGDLVSQADSLTNAQVNDLFLAAEDIMEPFDLGTNGRVIVSDVYRQTSSPAVVSWQRNDGGALASSSLIGAQGATATLPAGLTLAVGDDVIVTEAFYRYAPTLVDWFLSPVVLRKVSYFRPRQDALFSPPS
jgi:Flp pilus assembly protein TadG